MRPSILAGAICSLLLTAWGCDRGQGSGVADGEVVVASSDAERDLAVAQDPELVAAEQMIATGRAWRATQLLAPRLRTPEGRTPPVVLVAARAAAGWGGWNEVERILGGETWLDSRFAGEGRELLARAALERGEGALALPHATAAARLAIDSTTKAHRLVYRARALDRENQPDSAAAAYAHAAALLPAARDWLLLRAAGVQSDGGTRRDYYDDVKTAAAMPRIDWTEAQARARFGDQEGAAALYDKVKAPVQALRLRLMIAGDSGRRDAVRRELLDLLRRGAAGGDTRAAIQIVDENFSALSRDDELVIARAAAAAGVPARAVQGYERARRGGALGSEDLMRFGLALSRVGRTREAMTTLASVTSPRDIAAQAAYQRARLILSASGATAAQAALRDLVRRFPSEQGQAAQALALIADLYTDSGRDTEARAAYREIWTRFPRSGRADDARFHAAIIDIAHGNHRAAARQLDSLLAVHPSSNEAMAARYWSGRAHAALGELDQARARWRDAMAAQPTSYYAMMSARRLNVPGWKPTDSRAAIAPIPSVDAAIRRLSLLDRLGLDTESRFELDALLTEADSFPDRAPAIAVALQGSGYPSRGIEVALEAIGRGDSSATMYRVAYPVIDAEELRRQAQARSIDPALVAALIRQESWFNPRAISGAGARGLMQLMPPVGEAVARSLRFPVWSPALLLDANANLQIGTAHLASLLRQYDGEVVRVLAGYNAGGSRVTRWTRKPGTRDPEVLTERIPYVETRDYVRIVQRNREMYRGLYGW